MSDCFRPDFPRLRPAPRDLRARLNAASNAHITPKRGPRRCDRRLCGLPRTLPALFSHALTPRSHACPLDKRGPVCYTILKGRRPRPLWSAAVTSGAGDAAPCLIHNRKRTPENARLSGFRGVSYITTRPTRRAAPAGSRRLEARKKDADHIDALTLKHFERNGRRRGPIPFQNARFPL